jgi:uncharacterized protein (DUF1015 family)
MADIQAFRAFRYDLGRAGALADVIAPPFDCIDPKLRDSLEARSANNVVRVDLSRDEPGDSESRNRYTRAAAKLNDWVQTGIIHQDTARGLYVLHQEFELDGKKHTRKGFFSRVRLEPPDSGKIYPHEQTFGGPRDDRLKLMRATGMNLSSVFCVYPDEARDVQSRLDAAIRQALPVEAADHLGTINRIWPITDQKLVSEITGLMGPKPLFIADGHHRYATALQYRDERRAGGEATGDDAPANFVMMFLVAMNDSGLFVLPTHRVVSGMPNLTAGELAGLLKTHFAIEPAASASDAWERIELDGSQNVLGLGTADGKWQVARFTKPEVMRELAADHSPTWRALSFSILHRLVLDKLLSARHGGKATIKYLHDLNDVSRAVTDRSCDLAVLAPPVSMSDIEAIAGTREMMPQKATYFYPKVPTGLVFNSVKSH